MIQVKNARKIFVNLSVENLVKSRGFFEGLGFQFNPQFSDDHAACMVLSEEGFVMLLERAKFKDFTKLEICDNKTHVEALVALSCSSREEVDSLQKKAIELGGREAMPAQDLGFMYQTSFYDLDGHHWELFWMDMSGMPS